MGLQIWTEKYRPNTLNEVIGQKHVVNRLKAWVDEKSIPNMIFAGPAGIGKCVTPDTPIVLPNNEIIPIEEAFRRNVKKVLTLNKDGKITNGKIGYLYKSNKNRLLKVKTRSGNYVTSTPEHPFLVLDGGLPKWIEAKNIKKNFLLATPLKIPFTETEKEINIDWKGIPDLWAILESEISIKTHKMYAGAQKKILQALNENHTTCKKISIKTGLQIKTVRWATRKLAREGILDCRRSRPLTYSLNKKYSITKKVPIEEVKDTRKITKVFHKGKFSPQSYEIKYFHYATPELMEWAAMILADGNIRNSSIRFYNKNEKMLKKFQRLSLEILGKEIKWSINETKNVPYFEIFSGTATKLLKYIFRTPIGVKKSDIVQMPMDLMKNKKMISAFMRGYFQCDGYFSPKSGIEISSASKTILYQMKYTFLLFGITSKVFEKKKQFYLRITGKENILKFKELVRPEIKTISYNKKCCTNIDVMEINMKTLKHIVTTLGISYKDIADENEVEYVFERGRGGRVKIQKIYTQICELSRKKISKAMDCIAILNVFENSVNYEELQKDMVRVLQWMDTPEKRKVLEDSTKIRSDALKVYHEKKREPGINNFLAILNSLRELKVRGMEKTYNRLMNVLLIRRTVFETMRELGISFSEISKQFDTHNSNMANYMKSDKLTPISICKLPQIMNYIKSVIEERVFDQTLVSELSTLQFLSSCEIYWDMVTEIESLPGGTVYDLNVKDTHNFIGGHGAMILHNTTCSIALAKDIFGKHWHQNFQETNASEERGIDVVRGRIKDFARSKSIGADFKIIFLDESDSLTKDAQQALRRTMEKFSDATRFILNVNYSSRLIEPISSRCAVFRFRRLEKHDIETYINRIVIGEKLKIDNDAIDVISEISSGDLRRATNLLQACATYDKITKDVVYEISAHAKPKDVAEMLSHAVKGDFHGARKLLYAMLIDQGLAAEDIVKSIHSELFKLELPDKTKIQLIEKLGEYEFRLNQGATPEIQLEAFLASFLALKE